MPVAEEVRQAIEVFDQSQGARDRLSQWERDFMTDQQKRWEECGEDTHFSAKQIAVITKIWEKMNGFK